LPAGSAARAEQVPAGLTPASAREQEALKELADRQILAHPSHFEAAHHLVVKARECVFLKPLRRSSRRGDVSAASRVCAGKHYDPLEFA
jgi:hypothetical protein